jgi:uncharacterized protein YkwD
MNSEKMMKKTSPALWAILWLLPAAVIAQNRTDADGWNVNQLDTARNVSYLSRLEKDVILELNKARSNPPRYAELYIRPQARYFRGNAYSPPGPGGRSITTVEGSKAVEECYTAMSRMESVPLLYPREGLSLAAKDHVVDQGAAGTTGHTGGDGSSFDARISRYGKWSGSSAENLSYGNSTGRDIVCRLLIDDGVSSRGHRANNMNKAYVYVGVAAGHHEKYDTMCVIDFAAAYITANNRDEEREAAQRTSRQQVVQTQQLSGRGDPDGANWNNLSSLDGAGNADYLTGFEKDVFLELNKARTDPQKFAQLYISPTGSGAEAYNELSGQEGLAAFRLEKGMCLAAKDTEGSLGDRARKYGKWSGSLNEPTVTGNYPSGRDLVVALLRNKTNRERLLNAAFKFIGVSVGRTESSAVKGIVQFASNYTSN